MSFLKQIVDAIVRIERVIGLKTDYEQDTIFARLNKLESQNNSDILLHSRDLGSVIIPTGYNAILKNPVSFTDLTIEHNAELTIID